jgi:hypothetical protein
VRNGRAPSAHAARVRRLSAGLVERVQSWQSARTARAISRASSVADAIAGLRTSESRKRWRTGASPRRGRVSAPVMRDALPDRAAWHVATLESPGFRGHVKARRCELHRAPHRAPREPARARRHRCRGGRRGRSASGTMMETSGNPDRRALSGRHACLAADAGVMICVDTSAHQIRTLGSMRRGPRARTGIAASARSSSVHERAMS